MATKDCLVLIIMLLLMVDETRCVPVKTRKSNIHNIGGMKRRALSTGSSSIVEPDSQAIDLTKKNVVNRGTQSLRGNSDSINKHGLRRNKRAYVLDKEVYKWPKGVIPYSFKDTFSKRNKASIKWVMDMMPKVTCIQFRPATASDRKKIEITSRNGCEYLVHDDWYEFSLGHGCVLTSNILEQLLHVIGFLHEHNRPDRGQYINIHYENIKEGRSSKFDIENGGKKYGPYDYSSAMHADEYDWTKRFLGKTITAKDKKYQHLLESRKGWSFLDVSAVNTILNCGAECGKLECGENAFMDKNCECRCEKKRWPPYDPTQVCAYKMKFGYENEKTTAVNQAGNARLLCAYPFCSDYRIKKLEGISPQTISKTTSSSQVYYNYTAAPNDVVLHFDIGNIQCADAGNYTCSCRPRGKGSRVSTTWEMEVNGC